MAVVACALLAACSLSAPPPAAALPQPVPGPPDFMRPAPEPEAAAAGPGAQADGQAALTIPRPAVNDDPRRLIGLDQDAIQRLLGTPSFMRKDLPAQLWRYAGGGCVLDIFLYGKTSSGPFLVRHLSARASSAAPIAAPQTAAEINPRACLGELLRARSQPASG